MVSLRLHNITVIHFQYFRMLNIAIIKIIYVNFKIFIVYLTDQNQCCVVFNVVFRSVFCRWRSGFGSAGSGSVFWNVPRPEKEEEEIWDR